MSTDLEFPPALPSVRLPRIKIGTLQSSNPASSFASGVIPPESSDDECRTPTSDDYKIPAILSCPPAPRKPRFRPVPCKRKLSGLEFMEVVHRVEVEEFFKTDSERAGRIAKRRRPL